MYVDGDSESVMIGKNSNLRPSDALPPSSRRRVGASPCLIRKGFWDHQGQTLQVAVRKCMAESYSTSKKLFWKEINAFFDTVLSEINLGNVDTRQV